VPEAQRKATDGQSDEMRPLKAELKRVTSRTPAIMRLALSRRCTGLVFAPGNGRSMSSRIDRELAMNALLMAVWRRQPKNTVMMHSDQAVNSAAMTGATSWISTICSKP